MIQSYVERQGNAATDWEVNGSPPFESADQDLGQPSANHGEVRGNSAAIQAPVSLPLQPIPSPPTWDQESHHDNWMQHDVHQRLGIVCTLLVDASCSLKSIVSM